MTICTSDQLSFPNISRRKVEADFTGGDVSSDGGVLLLRQMDRRLKLTQTLASRLPDPREPAACDHARILLDRYVRYLCSVLVGLPRQQFPRAAVFLPHHHRLHAGRAWLAVAFILASHDVARDCSVATEAVGLLRAIDRFPLGFRIEHVGDKLRLVF